MPETSIVIRTYNEEKHLGNLLRAIKKQEYKNHEVIIVDSSSTDRTVEIAEEFKAKVIKIESRDFTFGYALNIGCAEAKGKYLVFASAHVLPTDHKWLSNLVAPFKNEKVAMVYGRQLGHETSKFSEKQDLKRLFSAKPLNVGVSLNFANNANSAVRRGLWEKRKFDEYLFGLEDIDWAKFYREKGYIIHYEPTAAIFHIHNEKWHQVFNRYRREAIAAIRIGLPHPPQSRIGFIWLPVRLAGDLLASFPNYSPARVEEILRFRYYQWKGSRQGWIHDKNLDLNREKEELFFQLTNQSVVIRDKHKAGIEETKIPELKPGDILIRVGYVGMCRTDIEVYEGTLGYYKHGMAHYPITPGHEFSGTIAKVGANNKYRERFKVGDKVVGECILSRGEHSERKEVGVINHNGAYSHYVVVPGAHVHHIPAELDLKIAALAEPLAVVLRAIRRIRNRLTPKCNIAIIGAGPIGNFSTQVLAAEGYKVTVFDKKPERLKFLEGKAHKTSTVLEGLEKFDVIIEATGSKEALEQILKVGRVNSTALLLGFPYGDINYNFEDLVGCEKFIVGSVGAESEDFGEALELLPKFDMEPFTRAVVPLNEFEKAWELHESGKFLKIIIQPQQ